MPPWEQMVRLPVLWHFGFTDTHELHLMGSNGTSKRRSGPEAVRLTAGLARIPGTPVQKDSHVCADHACGRVSDEDRRGHQREAVGDIRPAANAQASAGGADRL